MDMNQQRIQTVLNAREIPFDAIDIAAPGMEDMKI